MQAVGHGPEQYLHLKSQTTQTGGQQTKGWPALLWGEGKHSEVQNTNGTKIQTEKHRSRTMSDKPKRLSIFRSLSFAFSARQPCTPSSSLKQKLSAHLALPAF